jgi:hypothetical protein
MAPGVPRRRLGHYGATDRGRSATRTRTCRKAIAIRMTCWKRSPIAAREPQPARSASARRSSSDADRPTHTGVDLVDVGRRLWLRPSSNRVLRAIPVHAGEQEPDGPLWTTARPWAWQRPRAALAFRVMSFATPGQAPSVAPEIVQVREAITAFHEASERQTKILVRLTWVLVFLTAAVVALTIVVAVQA